MSSSQALNCALGILRISNGSSVLYDLSEENFAFFSDIFLPCLLGSSHWNPAVSDNAAKLERFSNELAGTGRSDIPHSAIDDFPAPLDNSGYFLIFYTYYELREREEGKPPDRLKTVRLEKIRKALELFTSRIFDGFQADTDPARRRNAKKPGMCPARFDVLYQTLRNYYQVNSGLGADDRRGPVADDRREPEDYSGRRGIGDVDERWTDVGGGPAARRPVVDDYLPPPNTMIQNQFRNYSIFFLLLFLLLLVFGIVTGIQALAERPPEFFRFEWSKKNTVRVEEKANTVSEFFQNLFRKKNVEPDSDKDSDGFTFEQEGVFRTNPNDPLSHPKYISMVRVSSIIKGEIPGVELISVDPSSVQKNKWYATFRLSDDPSDVKMLFPGDSFQVGNDTFRLVDLESGTTAERSVAYIQRAGSDNRIPCSVGSPVWFKQMEVDLIDTLTGKTIPTSLNATFKLGSARTGEEEYKVVDFQSQQNQVTVAAVRNNPDSICWTITDQAASSFKDQQMAEAAASQKKISAAGVHVDAERKTNATLAFSLLKSANIPTGSCIYFAIAKDHRHLDFAKEDEDGRLVTVGETDGTNFPYALLVSPKNTPQSAKPEETIVFYEDPLEFFDGVLIAFANGNIEYLEGNFWTHADVMKAAARTFELSAGTAAELQRKVTAFDGTATPEAEKPAGSSANTPKHITQITVSDISNFMEVKLIEADTSKRNKKDWIATFLINGVSRIKVPYGAAFSFNNARFELTDIETDKATGAPVASIQTPGKDVHDCPLNEERRFVVQKYIMLFNKQNSTYLFPVIGATFKLGTAMTGEETYKVISADTRTKEVIVESVSDSGHEKFALLPE